MELQEKMSEIKVGYGYSGLHLRVPFPVCVPLYTYALSYVYLFVCVSSFGIISRTNFVIVPFSEREYENALRVFLFFYVLGGYSWAIT